MEGDNIKGVLKRLLLRVYSTPVSSGHVPGVTGGGGVALQVVRLAGGAVGSE